MPGAGNDRKTEVQCTRHIGNDRKHNGTLNWLIIVFSFTYNNNQSFVQMVIPPGNLLLCSSQKPLTTFIIEMESN